jgi:hypothetical protein
MFYSTNIECNICGNLLTERCRRHILSARFAVKFRARTISRSPEWRSRVYRYLVRIEHGEEPWPTLGGVNNESYGTEDKRNAFKATDELS